MTTRIVGPDFVSFADGGNGTIVVGRGGKLRALDLKDPAVQEALRAAESAKSVYQSALASDYE